MERTVFCDTVLGCLKVSFEDDVVVGISFDASSNEGVGCDTGCGVCRELEEYLYGSRVSFSFRWSMRGTPFQCDVWDELRNIPYGEVRSYADIARAIGRPGASRAVGNACNRNPLLFVVPCHRVVGSDGSIGGFAAGAERKRFLLSMENDVAGKSETDCI